MIKNYDQILEWLNKIRAIYGAPPITEISKGQACNGNHCPLCNSLLSELHGVYQVDMSYDHYTLYTSFPLDYKGDLGQVQALPLEDGFMYTFWGTVPDFIRDFLIEIDDNQYPELAEPPVQDTEDSFDEGEEPGRNSGPDTFDRLEWDYDEDRPIRYEQTFVSKREWFFEEEDEEWDIDDWMDTDYYIWDY